MSRMPNRREMVLLALGGAACTRRPRLNVLNWSAYVAPETVANFEKEAGVQVRYAIYEANEEMLARVMSGNSGWDIVVPTHYFVPVMRDLGLLAELDHSLLPNLQNLEPEFRRPPSDPELRFSAPYLWNATGILYNRSLMPPPRSWADLWDARLKGRVTMLDDPAEVFAAALAKLGLPINTFVPAELEAAKRAAVAQKPNLRAYLNAEVRDQVVAGEVLAAQLWSTTAQQAIDAAPDKLGFVYPTEHFPLNLDCAVLLRESKRRELAHRFINYLLRPAVSARVSETMRTATASGAARLLLPAGTRDNAVLYPDKEVMARAEWFATPPPEIQRLRDRLWTEVKSS